LKKQIILYLATALITFLVLYIKNLSSPYYPVTSTFGIEENKISYRLDKIHYGEEFYQVKLLTELKGIEGIVTIKQGTEISEVSMNYYDKFLQANLTSPGPVTKLDYQIRLKYNDKEYVIPRDNSYITIEFYGKIPLLLIWLHYILLFSGLFLSIRIGLDYFDGNILSKKLSVIAISVFILYGLMINPLKNSYRLGLINKTIPTIIELFDLQAVLFLFVWILMLPLIFHKRTSKPAAIAVSIITLIIFISFPFII
jgi:hypothetical protein